jgi:hypothetical protein
MRDGTPHIPEPRGGIVTDVAEMNRWPGGTASSRRRRARRRATHLTKQAEVVPRLVDAAADEARERATRA